MLLYISSPTFIGRTFVISCSSKDSIARLKANILHILYEMGRGSHQFRLKFKSQYLKDSSTIEDYGIIDSHVINMIPLSNKSFTEHPLMSSASSLQSRENEDTLQRMLFREVNTLKRREKLCNEMQVWIWALFVFGFITFLTEYWYTGFYKCVFAILALYFTPKYTRLSGFYLRMNERNDLRILVISLFALAMFLSNLGLLTSLHENICPYITELPSLPCSEIVYFSFALYVLESIGYFGFFVLATLLSWNFKFQIGNYIEPVLVEIRDIKYIFAAAKSKSVKEQRSAGLDLANLAASSVDNKFALVAEGGLQVLIDLALSEDEGIRGYAIEAISELLTIKSIQNEFVEIGGVNTLMFALHSTDTHIVKESLLAICQLCQDNEDVMVHVLGENGMDDLCHVINTCRMDCVRLVAGIFLDVSFCDNLRGELLKHRKYVPVFERMIRCSDAITQQLCLQTLEMIALTSPAAITAHTSFIAPLLASISKGSDVQVKTISAKLLLYFVDNTETMKDVLKCSVDIKEVLLKLVTNQDNIMQCVAAKILFLLVENDRELLYDDRTMDLVQSLRINAVDQEAWMLSDKILVMRDGVSVQ
ncbi:uncharacterized protein LOC134814173 [Bolinopsis microptera]|uniref:uncharacterized protein LOC134814173 n=1 Tax=Bolinopsis microptera TaxID=2820187 RepID=UPI00307ABF35